MTAEFHDGDLLFYFVLLATEVVGDRQVRPRARDVSPLELVEAVGARVMPRHDLDSLRKGRWGKKKKTEKEMKAKLAGRAQKREREKERKNGWMTRDARLRRYCE